MTVEQRRTLDPSKIYTFQLFDGETGRKSRAVSMNCHEMVKYLKSAPEKNIYVDFLCCLDDLMELQGENKVKLDEFFMTVPVMGKETFIVTFGDKDNG